MLRWLAARERILVDALDPHLLHAVIAACSPIARPVRGSPLVGDLDAERGGQSPTSLRRHVALVDGFRAGCAEDRR